MAKPILEEKKYDHLYHMNDMMKDIAQLQLNEQRRELLNYDKPDSIPQNIARIEHPSKEQIVAQHISRFPVQSHSNNSTH